MSGAGTRRPAAASVPLMALRAAVVVVAGAAFALAPPPYAIAALVMALAGAIWPTSLLTWGALLVVALAQLGHLPTAGDWHPYLALVVVHLLHALGSLTLALPARGVLQLRALARPARRWLLVQVPAQVLLVVGLLAQRMPREGLVPAGLVAVAAAVCAVAIAVLLRALAPRR
ncbi:hypothetical protein GCM10022240_22250 [Microbacterium kribbense]|uniref:Uncharacterized protein n=1 Tax=Microbacterium kribbense TaxID=433645 RepID=A0ABP7GT19_9MICO